MDKSKAVKKKTTKTPSSESQVLTATKNKSKTTKPKQSPPKQSSGSKSTGDEYRRQENDIDGSVIADPQSAATFDLSALLSEKKPKKIDLELLASRCLNTSTRNTDPEFIVKKLNAITHLRLDRENINEIDNLDLINHDLKNIYLQHNCISKLEGLESFGNLQFLMLSHNQIAVVENITHLKRLRMLDLSHNLIEHVDPDELPVSLSIISLEGNSCQQLPEYRNAILSRCTKLFQLDGERLTVVERRNAGHDVETDSEEDETEGGAASHTLSDKSQLFDAEVSGVFDELSTDLFMRCQSRIQELFNMHRERLSALDNIRSTQPGLEDRQTESVISRISSRLDSPDTTDNSRPATGGQ